MRKFNETILYHSALMIRKTIRNYGLLSITLVLSFSFFLGYLVFNDSSIFNKYKETYSIPPDCAVVTLDSGLTFGSPEPGKEAQNALVNRLEEMEDTYIFTCYQYLAFLPQLGINATIYLIPENNVSFFWYDRDINRKFRLVSGTKTLTEPDQMLIDEESYFYLKNKLDGLEIICPGISFKTGAFHAVGIYANPSGSSFRYDRDLQVFEGAPNILLPQSAVSEMAAESINSARLIIYSKNIKQAVNEAKKLNIAVWSSLEDHQAADEMIMKDINTERIIIFALYVILCLNLYGCFGNALNARNFEIGVKRALGAKMQDIARQFAYEGLIVCAVNILLATAIVFNIALCYKCFLYFTGNIEWIIHLSGFSIAAYIICSVFLSVFLTVSFTYQSSKVEIVSYLKNE